MRKKALGTYEIAKICQVAPITVGRWIDDGKLPCFTTGGGHRRVWEEDLVKFLTGHGYPIPSHLGSSHNPTVLVVEDDTAARRLIRRLIEKKYENLKVEEAMDGYEAGEKVAALVPAIVVLDMLLPGVSGFKVCERIRANNALKKVKIMAVSSSAEEGWKKQVIKLGADVALSRPCGNEEFLEMFSRLAERI